MTTPEGPDDPAEADAEDLELDRSEPAPLEPYTFNADDVAGAATRLDEAYKAAGPDARWSGLMDILRGPDWSPDRGESALDIALGRIVAYRLEMHSFGEKAGCRLGPRPDEKYPYPMRISDVPGDEVTLWTHLAARVTQPGAVARLHDLLGERGEGSRRDHAARAVEAYLAINDATLRDDDGALSLSAVSYLLRAWDLTRRYGLWDKLAAIEQRLLTATRDELAIGEHHPGLTIPMLEALAAPPSRRQPARASCVTADEVRELLAQTFDLYPEEYLLRQTMDLARSLAADDDEREALTRDQAQRLLRHALEVDGHLRMIRLQEAIAFARNRSVKDVEEAATVELQKIPREALGLQSISSRMSLPADLFERFVTPYTDSPSWVDGIVHFLRTSCPTGSYQGLVEQERESAARFTLRRLFSTQYLTQEGRPTWTADTEEEKVAAEIAWIAGIAARSNAQVMAAGLHAYADRYGVPDENDLIEVLLEYSGANGELVTSLGRALRLYLQGEYEASANLIVPKIEAAARMLLLELDEAVFKIQVGKDPGGYGGLYNLLEALADICLDEDWAYFLQWLLLGSPGQNVRNDLSHGLVLDPGPVQAALILRAAALLITVTESDNAASPRTPDDLKRLLAAPTDPPTVTGVLEQLMLLTAKTVGTAAGMVIGLARLVRRGIAARD